MRLLSLLAPPTSIRSIIQRRWVSDSRPIAAGDIVLLRQKLDRSAAPILTRPLKPGGRIEGHKGIIQHDDIIGKRVRDVVQSTTTRSAKASTEYRIHSVTLEEYVRLTKRLVTPIYPADANLIVSLLDLHVDTVSVAHGSEDETPRLEILEAGTGHGALTLHLSRAVHAANTAFEESQVDYDSNSWKTARRAIIHTTDVSPRFSSHAQDIVRGFRHGIYARNIDFHVGDVSDVVRNLRGSRGPSPFLSHALLDLPAADGHLATVADALRVDGTLTVFNPSITQITECAVRIKNEDVPLDLDKVIELGVNASSGGREWDVRLVRPRATQRTVMGEPKTDDESTENSEDESAGSVIESHAPTTSSDEKWSMVCRPKVGDRIIGGGFLAIWKKQRRKIDEGS